MRILVDNTEIRSQRVAYPTPDAFEAVCQLIGITFRHERNSGIIAVDPPLIGRRVLVRAVENDPHSRNNLLDILKLELRLLDQLLWVSGADVTLNGVYDPVSLQDRMEVKSAYWDIALFIYPEQIVPGGIDPLAIYTWWRMPLRSWRLAGHLSAASEMASCLGFKRTTTWKLPSELKQWFSQALSEISAPAVLVSIPLVNGHVEPLLDSLSLSICQGVLSYFRKTPIESWARDALRQLPAPEKLKKPDHPQEKSPLTLKEDSHLHSPSTFDDRDELGELLEAGLRQRSGRRIEPAAYPQEGAGSSTAASSAAATPGSGMKREDTRVDDERELTSKATEESRRLAYESLSSRGIKPTKELIDEYLLYLQRMTKQSGSGNSSE